MLNGKSGPRAFKARRRRVAAGIGAEMLEARQLMAIDLANVATAPYGVRETGLQAANGVGWSVTDVGDLTNSGFDDFVVGGPSVIRVGNTLTLGNGANTSVYLVFGSQRVNATTLNANFANLSAQQRIGDLGQLGNGSQTNPTNGLTGFDFNGLTITASQNTNALLGASVQALGYISGTSNPTAFMIGAPGALNAAGTSTGTGRAYIIYGGPAMATSLFKTIDLDNPSSYPTPITTLVSNNTGAHVGYSVAAVGNVAGDGGIDIAVGAPLSSVDGLPDAGEVYLMEGSFFSNRVTRTLDIDLTGQPAGIPGVIFSGANAGDQVGYSVSTAGDFDGRRTTANQIIDDLLIGSPQLGTGPGQAYLVYGQLNLTAFATPVAGRNEIALTRIGGTVAGTTGGVPGVDFLGTGSGDQTGWSVASAGTFFGTALGDIMIGSPQGDVAGATGRVYLIHGVAAATPLNGTIDLSPTGTNPIPTADTEVILTGPEANSLAGFAEAPIGDINGDGINEIAIGAPGYQSGMGTVYLVPGNANLAGTYNLATATTLPSVAALQITLSGSVSNAFLGASVAGQLPYPGQQHSLDGLPKGDLIIGAPGFSLQNPGSNPPTTSRLNAGAVYALEGQFIPLGRPVSTIITTTIGVNTFPGPFTLNLATTTFTIFVLSNKAANFRPVTDINPGTITVNGIAFPNATVAADPKDENGDGIPDAIVTLSPSSALNFVNGTATVTIAGRTTAASGNNRFTGTTTVTVVGGNGGGGTTGAFSGPRAAPGTTTPVGFIPPIGTALIPSIASLSNYDSYQPLPATVAFGQFLPSGGYLLRMEVFTGKIKRTNPEIQRHEVGRKEYGGNGVNTLGNHVFRRDRYHAGKTYKFTHKVEVIPRSRQTDVYHA